MSKMMGARTFQAGDETYTLQFSVNGLCALEDATGMGIMEFIERFQPDHSGQSQVTMQAARTLFWAGLQQHHPDLSLQQVGDLMDRAGGFEAAINLVTEAFESGMPDADAASSGNGAAPQG